MAAQYDKDLNYLHHLLHNLPSSIPLDDNHYHFDSFECVDPEWVELTGTDAGALNHLLEVTFGRRDQGFIKFKEHGPGLEGVVHALRKYITGTEGENGLLLKWIDDLISAAKEAYQQAGMDAPSIAQVSCPFRVLEWILILMLHRQKPVAKLGQSEKPARQLKLAEVFGVKAAEKGASAKKKGSRASKAAQRLEAGAATAQPVCL